MIPQLKSYTTYSLRKSINKPEDLIRKCKDFGYNTLAVTEKGNIFSFVKINKLCKDANIKHIIGCELYINTEGKLSNLTILCKNKKGFSDLLKIISKSNSHENFNLPKEVATIKLDELASIASSNFIVYDGCIGGFLSSSITDDYSGFVKATEYNAAKSLVNSVWKEKLEGRIGQLQEIFGKDNFFLEYQNLELQSVPASDIMGKIIKDAGKRLKIPIVATCKPHYINQKDYDTQQILICIDKKTPINHIKDTLENQGDTEYYSFFRNKSSYLLSPEEYVTLYDKEFLENNKLVDSLCENYDVLSNPKMPSYECPSGLNSISYLKQLCQEGWNKVPIGEDANYQNRLNDEMKIIGEVGLAPYFLVVWDIFRYVNENGWLSAVRGSAGGSIIAYLLGLSEADPIKYNLVFSRFYNEGRNQPGKISLCDIDIDVPIQYRKNILDYLRNKYGHENTASIATFGSLKGASSLKEILRSKNVCSADEANEITKLIVDEHKISDELAERRKEGEEATILGWSIENIKGLHQYAQYDNDGNLVGDYAQYFEQAIKLEGCKRNLSKHACGIVIGQDKLSTYCPMVKDKNSEEPIIGLSMEDVEAVGGMKLDLLGSANIDDVMESIRLARCGDLIK